jgi:hypothetical protein
MLASPVQTRAEYAMKSTRTKLFVVVAAFLGAAGPGLALAQSSPYAGSWSGTSSYTGNTNCTCSGSCGGVSPLSGPCSGTQSWTGTVDAQGNFTTTYAGGTSTCTFNGDSYTTDIPASAPQSEGQIGANGRIVFPPENDTTTFGTVTTTVNCPGGALQFSLSPASVSGTFPCSSTSSDSQSGYTLTCQVSTQSTFTGTGTLGSSGTGVLVPPQPVFPITVNTNITPTTASASAQIQPPPSLVGTTGSVFVFAHTKLSTLTKSAKSAPKALGMRFPTSPLLPKDAPTPDPCVLAQLNSSGQLVAASGSSLGAYATGVLSSQSQAVTILNNVSTPSVAGSTFLVGYGQNSGSMLNGGTYQGAVTVAGSSGCSAALLAGAAPNAPGALSGLWWNQNESGWGIGLTQRRNVVFGAWYTYDAVGNPKWYVASSCAMPAGVTGTSGTCSGTLYQVSGPIFFGTTFNPALANVVSVGTLTIAFQDANTAMMTYTVNGQSRTIPITRTLFQTGSIPPAIDYTDLWYNPTEAGWGMTVAQQYGMMFLAWYVYNGTGNPVWYVAPACVVSGSSCTGDVYSTTGPPLGPTFNPASVRASSVGTVTVNFLDANNASLNYTVNGVSGQKAITRDAF